MLDINYSFFYCYDLDKSLPNSVGNLLYKLIMDLLTKPFLSN